VYVLLTIIDAVKDIVKTNPACKIIICERSLSAQMCSPTCCTPKTCSTPPNTIFIVDCTKKYPPTTGGSNRLSVVRWTWLETEYRKDGGRAKNTLPWTIWKCDRYYDKLITATEIPHIQIDVSKHITIESVEDGLAYYDGWINEIFGFINYGFEV
jgi:hypothetical protein